MVRKDQKEIKFVERQDPDHPYCTNWPMSEEEKEEKMTRKVLKEVMFEEENEIEICISCGKETKYKKVFVLTELEPLLVVELLLTYLDVWMQQLVTMMLQLLRMTVLVKA